MNKLLNIGFVILALSAQAFANPVVAQRASSSVSKVMVVIFENADYKEVIKQPFFGQLAKSGANLTQFFAETHPSQPNYIALIAGDTLGVSSDSNFNLDSSHLGDLLETAGKNWKIYLEDYPGKCFTGATTANYARKHNPFISFKNIQNNSTRCNAHLVNAQELTSDIQANRVPEFSIYIPNLKNDGHDTGMAFADKWYSAHFAPLLNNVNFMKDFLLISTFDEGSNFGNNQIFTVLNGAGIVSGSTSASKYSHYSLLRTLEDVFGLGRLGRKDATAESIVGIWK